MDSSQINPLRLMVIGGHGRSGTGVLLRTCNSHRDIQLTREFRNFSYLNQSLPAHVAGVRKEWRSRSLVQMSGNGILSKNKIASANFLAQYLLRLLPFYRKVDADAIRHVLHQVYPKALVAGDKRPGYGDQLDNLTTVEGLAIVVIYRDCRDVARSALEMSRGAWRHLESLDHDNVLGSVSTHWVKSIEDMEKYRDKIFTVRYEDFVADPQATMKPLAKYIGVDPEGFSYGHIHRKSVGKHRQELSSQQIDEILTIAGPAMARLNYI